MNGKIAIVTDDPGWHGAQLKNALAARGWKSEFVSLQNCRFDPLTDGHGVYIPGFSQLPDGVFVRGVPGGTLEQVVFHLDILHALKCLGVHVYNDGRAIERSVDKGMTAFLLQSNGIPTPAAWTLRADQPLPDSLLRALAQGEELVIKPLFGSQGEGLRRIAANDELPDPEQYNGVYHLQHYIAPADGQPGDWRVFVIGGKAVAAMKRMGSGWVNNVAQGASCRLARLETDLGRLAEAATAVLEMSYAGVDILMGQDGCYQVIEVNGVPAWKGLQGVCETEIVERLVSDFLGHCRRSRPLEAAG